MYKLIKKIHNMVNKIVIPKKRLKEIKTEKKFKHTFQMH